MSTTASKGGRALAKREFSFDADRTTTRTVRAVPVRRGFALVAGSIGHRENGSHVVTVVHVWELHEGHLDAWARIEPCFLALALDAHRQSPNRQFDHPDGARIAMPSAHPIAVQSLAAEHAPIKRRRATGRRRTRPVNLTVADTGWRTDVAPPACPSPAGMGKGWPCLHRSSEHPESAIGGGEDREDRHIGTASAQRSSVWIRSARPSRPSSSVSRQRSASMKAAWPAWRCCISSSVSE